MKKIVVISFVLTLILACFSVCYAGSYYDILDTKYEGIVECLSYLKIVDGVGNNLYDANKVVTRAEIAKMLVLAHGYQNTAELLEARKSFKDVKSGSWYYDYVNIASAYGLLKGYPDGNFYPDREVTYAEVVAMILRSLGHHYIKEDSEFGWYYNYIQRMRDLRLNEGMEVFYNERGAKRGDVAILIWNMLNQNTWEVIEEEGTGNLTYSNSGKVLFNKVFGKEFTLVSGKKLKSFSGALNTLYANIEEIGEVELKDVLPMYVIGGKVTGVLHKKDHLLVCAVYDIDLAIVDGYADELQKDGYSTKGIKDKYYFGGKEEDYIFFMVKRDSLGETIDRAIILDLDSKVIVEKTAKEKNLLIINEGELSIDVTQAVLLDGKKQIEWSKLSTDDSLLGVGRNVFILANNYQSEFEKKRIIKNNKKDDNFYYIASMGYNDQKVYLNLVSSGKSAHYLCTAELKDFSIGDFVNITVEGNVITKIAKANSKDYAELKLGKELILNYSGKTYGRSMFGKYEINKDTMIYRVNKRYRNNSSNIIDDCTLEEMSQEELKYVDEETVNMVVTGDVANVIYVEIETNKFSKFFGRVKDVYTVKGKITIDVTPVDSSKKTYTAKGKVECEIGDIISYTLSGKEGEEVIIIDEIYHGTSLGYKGDLIVESVNGKEIQLTNGDHFNQTSNVIHINDKDYKLSKYAIVEAKVRKSGSDWTFAALSFAEMRSIKFAKGDRIAIDEIEGLIVVYSGYTD